ncbi:MAG: GAF domain-containing protein [Micromonosporaceae bacterium]|nr:GAF domain-containing protein [Micromonosporaceae bacterium]
MEQLSAAVLAVTRHRSVREVLQTIVSTARELLAAEYAALGVPDDAGGFAEFVVDGVSDEQWEAIGPLPRQHGILAVMLREATPQRLPDVRADPRFGWWPAAHPVLVDFLGMPILDGEEILGALYLANRYGGGGFTDADERLLRVLAGHAAIALTNARLYEGARELALAEERARIAQELHDAVTQKLFSARLTAEAAAALVEVDPARARAELAEVARLTAEAGGELRGIVSALRPAELAVDGLVGTLRARVALLDRVHGATVTLDLPAELPPLSGPVEETLLRVAEEALHNALRHAAATEVRMSLATAADRTVTLTVTDDGAGFDVDTLPQAAARRLGLASMRERARTAGGTLRMTSARGQGTTVRLVVPGG